MVVGAVEIEGVAEAGHRLHVGDGHGFGVGGIVGAVIDLVGIAVGTG